MSRSLTSKNIRNFVPVLKPKISNDFPSPLKLRLSSPSDESDFTKDSSCTEEENTTIDSTILNRSNTFKLKQSKTILTLLSKKH